MESNHSNRTLASFYLGHARRSRLLMAHLLQVLLDTRNLEIPYTPALEKLLISAAFHHDLGKLAVPQYLLQKPGKLTAEEFEIVKSHTWLGEKLAGIYLHGSPEEQEVLRIVCRHHHERWDGKGYPDGLSGQEIPYPARLMAVVDVYDALTHERPYKPAYDSADARRILEAGTGTQFDPVVVQTFLGLINHDINRNLIPKGKTG